MRNAILIMEMPSCCEQCKLGIYNDWHEEFECFWTGNNVIDPDRKMDNCPLIEISEPEPSFLDKMEPFLNWCKYIGNEFNLVAYQKYLDKKDIDENVE